jgi:kynurenine formamidase
MYVDLSHVLEHGMITYQGLPGPVISEHLSREASRSHYAPGTEFHIGKIEMVANTGTYLDSPFHRYPAGTDLAGLPLEALADLPGVLLRVDPLGGRSIGAGVVGERELAGRAVLFYTGWDQHWRTDQYSSGHPFLSRAAAERLIESKVSLVGIDSFNIDDVGDLSRPAHSLLLNAGIPIVEHLTGLWHLPESGFRFFAVPPKIKGFGTFPVRAFAITTI